MAVCVGVYGLFKREVNTLDLQEPGGKIAPAALELAK